MFLNGAQAEVAAKGAEASDRFHKRKGVGGGGDDAIHKMLWSLDSRIRTQEGKVPSFFLLGTDPVLVPALIQGNATYDSLHTKGVAHPLGPRRTTLAAAFLRRIAEADLSQTSEASARFLKEADQIAAFTKTITILEQQKLLIHLLTTYTSANLLETEIAACLFFKCKKPNKEKNERYFFSIEIQPSSPMIHIYPFIRLAMIGAAAIPADGPPPLGPLIRDIPRNKK